jgi:hypothetical protein
MVQTPGRAMEIAAQRLLYDEERIARTRRSLAITVPKRSVVKLERASTAPVTIHVVLRRRSD